MNHDPGQMSNKHKQQNLVKRNGSSVWLFKYHIKEYIFNSGSQPPPKYHMYHTWMQITSFSTPLLLIVFRCVKGAECYGNTPSDVTVGFDAALLFSLLCQMPVIMLWFYFMCRLYSNLHCVCHPVLFKPLWFISAPATYCTLVDVD